MERDVIHCPHCGAATMLPARPARQPAETEELAVGARLVVLAPGVWSFDGHPTCEVSIAAGGSLEIGREAGSPWDADEYLDSHHARLSVVADGVRIDALSDRGRVYARVNSSSPLFDGDEIMVGCLQLGYAEAEPIQTTDAVEAPTRNQWGLLHVLVDGDRRVAAYPLAERGALVGREVADILFPDDAFISRTHCRIGRRDGAAFVEDLGSSNGTYVRVRADETVPFGSVLLVGQTLFLVQRSIPSVNNLVPIAS